jgi:hypothetical protein
MVLTGASSQVLSLRKWLRVAWILSLTESGRAVARVGMLKSCVDDIGIVHLGLLGQSDLVIQWRTGRNILLDAGNQTSSRGNTLARNESSVLDGIAVAGDGMPIVLASVACLATS